MVIENEKQLLTALQHGDPAAMKVIFQKYHERLCRVSYLMTQDVDAAKDVVQDVLLKLWQHRNKLNIQVSLEFYLKRSVVNTTLNFLERNKKQAPFELSAAELAMGSTPTVDHEHHAKELAIKIDAVLQTMPPRTRAVFNLVRFNEMSYRETAESLGISVKAVEKEMMKALSILRGALKDYLLGLIFLFL